MDKWGIIGQEEDRRQEEDKLITNPNKAGQFRDLELHSAPESVKKPPKALASPPHPCFILNTQKRPNKYLYCGRYAGRSRKPLQRIYGDNAERTQLFSVCVWQVLLSSPHSFRHLLLLCCGALTASPSQRDEKH